MASNKVGEAYIEIRTDDAPMSKGLSAAKSKATQWTKGLGESVGKIGAALAVGKFALSGADALRDAVMSAADLNETASKTGVVFGEAVGTVTAFADDMAAKFGSNKQVMMDAASSIGLIGKAAGMSKPAAADMSVAMARLADDASSFYNVPLDEALETIRSALVGESEPIRKFGVLLNEDAVKAEALRLGLVRVGGQLTESAKVMARVSLIQKGMADATGDHERTYDSFSNKVREIGGRLKNIGSDIGQALLPIAEAGASIFNGIVSGIEWVISKIKEMLKWIRDVPDEVVAMGGVAGLALKGLVGSGSAGKAGGPAAPFKPAEPTAAEKAKALNDKALGSVESQKESDALKKRIEVIQEEQRLEAKKEQNRKAEIEVLKARRLDSWLIKEKGPDGKVRDAVPESRRGDVDKIMSGYLKPEGLLSLGKEKLGDILGRASQMKQTALGGLAIGADMLLSKPKGVLTGVTDSESYRRSAQDSILNGQDTPKQLLLESKKQTSELQAIKDNLLKQGKGVVTAVFG